MPEQACCLTLVVAGICAGIATAFASAGAWPVVPFTGLEIAALWFAVRRLRRRAEAEERLKLTDRQLIVGRHNAGRKTEIGRLPGDRQKREFAGELGKRPGTA